LDAHADEQRREKADARVPFLLVSFLWARKEKTLAYRRKRTVKSSKELPSKTSNQIAAFAHPQATKKPGYH
jgi:hypothetical protein